MTKHKPLVAAYLQTNFDMFFQKYNSILVQSESYVTKRQSIKLLGEILLDRANYNVMTTYVDSGEHLKIIMKLLRDDRRMINYEGFHVFKVRPHCHYLIACQASAHQQKLAGISEQAKLTLCRCLWLTRINR